MFKKLLISIVVLMSALGASTTMAVNLSTATAPVKYANDSLVTASTTAGVNANLGTTFTNIASQGAGVAGSDTLDLDLRGVLGVGVAQTDVIFVRFDLTNAAWQTGLAAGDLTVSIIGAGGAQAVPQGGAAGESFAIFQITSAGAGTQTDAFVLDLDQLAVSGDSTASFATYETLTNAVNQTSPLSGSSKSYVALVDGLTVTTDADNQVAQVSTLFTAYVAGAGIQATAGGNLVADLGDIAIASSHNGATSIVMEEDGTTHVIADSIIAATSVVTVAGDMSSGTYYFTTGGTCAVTAPTTAGTGKITMAADNLSGTALLSNANTAQFCHLADGATGIPAGGFTFSVAYTTATGTNAHADNASAYGSVSHNGSTSQVPYLTTFEDYNQRLVIVNRSTADADYTITFTTETDTTATAGTAATGTVTAQSVLSIKASDIVTLTGKTRTAATVVIVGPPASIEVATNQVNLSDGSTDTVKYTVQ